MAADALTVVRRTVLVLLVALALIPAAALATSPSSPLKAHLETGKPPRVGEPMSVTVRIEAAYDTGWDNVTLYAYSYQGPKVTIEPAGPQRFEGRADRAARLSWTVTPEGQGFWGIALNFSGGWQQHIFFSSAERGDRAEDLLDDVDVDLDLETHHVGGRNFTAEATLVPRSDWLPYADAAFTFGIWPELRVSKITTQPITERMTVELPPDNNGTLVEAYATVTIPFLLEHENKRNVACESASIYADWDRAGAAIPAPCHPASAPRYPGELVQQGAGEHLSGEKIPLAPGVLALAVALAVRWGINNQQRAGRR